MSTLLARLIRSLTVLALTVPLAAVPTAAQARYSTHVDARGDVFRFDRVRERVVPLPNRADGDVIGTRLRHTDTRVQIRVRFAELRRPTPQPLSGEWVDVRIVTNEGVRRLVQVVTNPRHRARAATMYRLFDYTEKVRCPIYRSSDYVHNVVTVGFPRACLSWPRWVRFNLEALSYDENYESLRRDDGLAKGEYDKLAFPDMFLVPLVFSSRVYRG